LGKIWENHGKSIKFDLGNFLPSPRSQAELAASHSALVELQRIAKAKGQAGFSEFSHV